MSDLVGNIEYRFSRVAAHMIEKGKGFHKKRNMKAVIKGMVELFSSKKQRGCVREN